VNSFKLFQLARNIPAFMRKSILITLIFITIVGCASTKNKGLNKKIFDAFSSGFYKNQFVGFMVYDPQTMDTLFNHNGKKYFTPASNTKIFTLYTGLKLLPKNIPAIRYIIQNNTLFLEGTGDLCFPPSLGQ